MPIVFVEFPHYHGSLFFAPEGWNTECTFLVNVGVRDSPGVCTAFVDSAAVGIAPGRSARFNMRIDAAGAIRAGGEVFIRFADGTEAVVAGVELPQAETTGEKYVPLIGLGVMLLVVVIVQKRRTRSRAVKPRPAASPRNGRC
ncbi:MAG: hypothetical protein IIA44_09540 [Acidobacteria bacterium]|nr:hypothetical protein [Acidobacteriota bacterium]